MRYLKIHLITIMLSICLISSLFSVLGNEPIKTETKITTAAVFKNGLSFFIREGKVKLIDDWGTIPTVPQAALGSLWLSSSDTEIAEIIASEREVEKQNQVVDISELLVANVGKIATVAVKGKEYSGEILSLASQNLKRDRPDLVQDVSSPLLAIKSTGKLMVFKHSDIDSLTFTDSPKTYLRSFEKVKQIRFKVKKASESVNTSMCYLQKGLSWIPAYLIRIKDEKVAQITLQAILVNDVEDLVDTEISFVVGVPNFAFADVISPMALQQSLAQFISSMKGAKTGSNNRQLMSNTLAQARNVYMDEEEFDLIDSHAIGSSKEDLFFYDRQSVNLKNGERGIYNIFTSNVNYEHIYQWEVSNSKDDPGQVWHSLRLTNSTNVPWTTAPAIVTSESKPIAQEILNYIPSGANGTLNLTVATDIKVDKREIEINRQPAVKRRDGDVYDAITIEGTLKVKNYKSKDIKLTIKKSLEGDVLAISDAGKTEKLVESIRAINPDSQMTWEVRLKAGEEKIITYKYKTLIQP